MPSLALVKQIYVVVSSSLRPNDQYLFVTNHNFLLCWGLVIAIGRVGLSSQTATLLVCSVSIASHIVFTCHLFSETRRAFQTIHPHHIEPQG